METRETLIIADDDSAILTMLTEIAEAVGFQVLQAQSGEEAIVILQRERFYSLPLNFEMHHLV